MLRKGFTLAIVGCSCTALTARQKRELAQVAEPVQHHTLYRLAQLHMSYECCSYDVILLLPCLEPKASSMQKPFQIVSALSCL